MGETSEADMSEQLPPLQHNNPPQQNNAADASTPAAPVSINPVARFISRMSIMQMTMAVVLLIFLWQWFEENRQINNMQQELARRLTEMDGSNKASQMLVAQSQDATRELSAKVAVLEAHYAETQGQRAALETLYQQLSSSRDETVLAEVEQMLLIASQQLQLSSNVKAALIAMQQADDYLKRLNRPALNGLRKTIGHDMDKLRILPDVDVPNINLHLDSLIDAVDGLPLAQDFRTTPDAVAPASGTAATVAPVVAGPGWRGLLAEIWQDIKHLVRIENTHKDVLPLLSPTQTFFLRENLKLRLLSARLALLARDEASFRHDLQAAQQWIARYFDVKNPSAEMAANTLQQLRESRISIELPDISASLEGIRNYRISREKPAK
ncbi:MAG: uroporphyrinogen-III C-methyltransferase [Pseudomonadota bacterium]